MSNKKFGEFHSGIGRRQFCEKMGLLVGAAALPSSTAWLSGCGKDPTLPETNLEMPFDPTIPWWLQGNFAPVTNEVVLENLEVNGSIPSELDGLYVRNGSNPQSGESSHWFFGDGMLHGVRLENGKALWYRNKFVQTGLLGIDSSGVPPTGGNNASNVSAIYHGDRLLTSGEIGLPFEIDPNDLSTRGLHTFNSSVDNSFTAHPKIDPATGYMHFFGYIWARKIKDYSIALLFLIGVIH